MTHPRNHPTTVDRAWAVQLGGRAMATVARYEIEDPTTGSSTHRRA